MENQEEENPVEPIELSIFKEHIENNFLSILNSLPNLEKCLILEESCTTKLSFLTTREKLREKNISQSITLKEGNLMASPPVYVYLIPPELQFLKIIDGHMEANNKNVGLGKDEDGKEEGRKSKEYHIIFLPKITNECQTFIKDSYNCALYNIHNLNMDIYPLDYELMSLEEENCFHQLYVTNNYN